jgi:hypothetical protein
LMDDLEGAGVPLEDFSDKEDATDTWMGVWTIQKYVVI